MNCGTGLQISVAYDAPGIAWLGTKGSAHQVSTGGPWAAFASTRVKALTWEHCTEHSGAAPTGRVRAVANSSPSRANQGNSDPWVFPRSLIASCRRRSSRFWSPYSKHASGMSRTDSVRVGAATAHSSIFAWPRKTSTVDGKRHDTPYQWVVEGDIQGCFDHIDHHLLMNRVRQHCADRRVNRWLVQFLKAGALSEEQFRRTDAGTPQGGIISPLLANIALSVIEERYERWVNHQTKRRAQRSCDGITAAMEARSSDRRAGRPVYFPVRYADDFIVLVSGAAEDAAAERAALATLLQQRMGLPLSPGKTRITPLTEGFEFLGPRASRFRRRRLPTCGTRSSNSLDEPPHHCR